MDLVQTQRIPALIKRNTLLLAGAQAFVGMGTQLLPTLGGIMTERLLGSMVLAGLGASLLYSARLVIAYPIGWVMDAYGRKAGLMVGLVLSLVGGVTVGLAMALVSFPLFLAGVLVFGFGVGAGQQLRTAAADMYLPHRRAEGLGYVLTGSILGALGGPLLIGAASAASVPLRIDPTALAWLLVPAVVIPSMALVLLIHPDPKTIATDLARFYPGYQPRQRDAVGMLAAGAGVRTWLGHRSMRVALASMFAAHGTMVMMMALTPLAMAHSGHALTMISLAVSLHVVGMFGLSLPLGRAADRVGRRGVILWGLGIVAGGSLLVPLAADYWVATAGLVLIGVGWSCVNVAATALVAETVPATERGRAVGVLDGASGLASIALPLAGGPLAEAYGFMALAVLAFLVVLGPALLAARLEEVPAGEEGFEPSIA